MTKLSCGWKWTVGVRSLDPKRKKKGENRQKWKITWKKFFKEKFLPNVFGLFTSLGNETSWRRFCSAIQGTMTILHDSASSFLLFNTSFFFFSIMSTSWFLFNHHASFFSCAAGERNYRDLRRAVFGKTSNRFLPSGDKQKGLGT